MKTPPFNRNLHTHCRWCDGADEPRAYILEALRQGLAVLGFSSHAETPYNLHWTLKPGTTADYLREIGALKAEFMGRIDVRAGLEVDYLPGVMGPASSVISGLELDFTIGSVHLLAFWHEGHPWAVDCGADEFERGLRELFNGSIRAVVEEYYRRVRDMAAFSPPTVLGHIDLVKKNNRNNRYFSGSESWYRDAVMETLEAVARTDVVVEVNTGGMARGKCDELYPAPWILSEMRRLNIPIVVNSDAHRPEMLTACFDAAAAALADAKYDRPVESGAL